MIARGGGRGEETKEGEKSNGFGHEKVNLS